MPSLEDYNSLYQYIKENLSDYHYDPKKDDSQEKDMIVNHKFDGDWQSEIEHFDAVENLDLNLDRLATRKQFQEWLDIGYSTQHFGSKSKIDPFKMPKLYRIVESIPLDQKQSWLTKQKPGQWIPVHSDLLASAGFSEKDCVERGQRILVFVSEWQPGHFVGFGNRILSQWEPGDIVTWPAHKYPHSTANTSHSDAYRLRISGLRQHGFLDWASSNNVLVVD